MGLEDKLSDEPVGVVCRQGKAWCLEWSATYMHVPQRIKDKDKIIYIPTNKWYPYKHNKAWEDITEKQLYELNGHYERHHNPTSEELL